MAKFLGSPGPVSPVSSYVPHPWLYRGWFLYKYAALPAKRPAASSLVIGCFHITAPYCGKPSFSFFIYLVRMAVYMAQIHATGRLMGGVRLEMLTARAVTLPLIRPVRFQGGWTFSS